MEHAGLRDGCRFRYRVGNYQLRAWGVRGQGDAVPRSVRASSSDVCAAGRPTESGASARRK
jgi:hypothetical protein